MGKLEIDDIRSFVQTLSVKELKQLEELIQAELWDRQIEADSAAGKLDALAEKALADHRAGRTRPL